MRVFLISKYMGDRDAFYPNSIWDDEDEAQKECDRLNQKNIRVDVFFTCGPWEVHQKLEENRNENL